MQTSSSPSKDQKEFHQALRQVGCVITGEKHRVQLHHVVGRTYKHTGIAVGHWFVLILHIKLHERQMGYENNVTDFPERFVRTHGTQVDLYTKSLHKLNLAVKMGLIKQPPMPPPSVLTAIRLTGK